MRLKLFLLVTFFSFGLKLAAQTYKNEFGFKSDNDAYLFTQQDRYYTNGLFLYFRHATDQQQLGEKLEKLTYEITGGQKMYNPYSGYAPDPAKQDRPFAAYLYAGGEVSLFYKKESILKVGAEFGVVGADALGEDAQKLLHKTVGFYEIEGWDYQIRNNFALNISAQYDKLLHRSAKNELDFSLETELNVGTTYTNAGVGILFRTGSVNQLFSAAHHNAVISNHAKTTNLKKSECYFYAKPQLNVIAYDATIQGGMFNNDSPITFNPKRLVFAQQVGFDYSSSRFTFDFGLTFKTKEIKGDLLSEQYGAISMYYRFN